MTNSRPRCAILPARASASAPQPKNTSPRIGPFIAPPTSCASINRCSGEPSNGSVVSTQTGTPRGMYSRSTAIERAGVKGAPSAPIGPSSVPQPCQLAKEDIRTVLRHYAGGLRGVLFQPRTDALHGDVRPLELPAVDQHLADGHIRPGHCARRSRHARPVLRAGEPVRSPGSAERRHRSGSPDRESAAHDCPMRRLRFRAVPVWHETAVLHPPSDAPAGEVGREGTQIDLNQVGRTRQKRGLHSRIGLPGACHLRLEIAGQKAIGAPIVADGIRPELPLQKCPRGGLIACGHRSSGRAHTRPADGQIHTGDDHSALRLSGRERIRVLATLQQRGHCLGHPIRLPTRQVPERDRGKAQLIRPGTGAAREQYRHQASDAGERMPLPKAPALLRRVARGSHQCCRVRLVNRMSNVH